MNIKDFIEYKDTCYFCNSKLELIFFSKRRQAINYANDNIVVLMDLNPKLGINSVKFSFNFDRNTNKFIVNFYDKNYQKLYKIPVSILKSFKNYFNNFDRLQLYKSCNKCKNYNYHSNSFKIDFKNRTIGDLSIKNEFYKSIKIINDKSKIYEIHNNYFTNESSIMVYWDHSRFNNEYFIKTNIISINNKIDIQYKLDALILFS